MAALTALLAGCQRLSVERTYDLSPGLYEMISVEGPQRDQKLAVTVRSPGAPVDVYVVLDDNLPAVEKKLTLEKAPDRGHVLASRERVEDGTVEATVPAKKDFTVIVAHPPKPAKVEVKVKGS